MDERSVFSVILRERRRREIEIVAEAVSRPGDPEFGRHRSWSDLAGLVGLDEVDIRAAHDWFAQRGMTVITEGLQSPQHFLVEAGNQQILEAFQVDASQWDACATDIRRSARIIPEELATSVERISGVLSKLADRPCQSPPRPETADDEEGASAPPAPLTTTPVAVGGVTPADIRALYQFPDPAQHNGAGETIALLMFEGEFDHQGFKLFWDRHGGGQPLPQVHVVEVGPKCDTRRRNEISNLEVAMSVQWAAAMAPVAKIVVYFVDPAVFADPWAAFLMEIIADETHAPTVAAISWVSPERDYYRKHGHRVIVGLLAQAACRGISVVAAAGDWGPFDGKPRDVGGGKNVVNPAWPQGVFPAVEEMVLGVGGTMVTVLDPLTEIAWSGPPPLYLQERLATKYMAGSGGFSGEVAKPAWQTTVSGAYSRGAAIPAVIPYGRGFPDVALMASGPAIQPSPTSPDLSCQGYQAVTMGEWVDYAGGTSIGAPIWAALLALANQVRRGNGLSGVGWVNPRLYTLGTAQPAPFRPILNGQADVVLWAVNEHKQAVLYHLDGYRCLSGWDPVTGLGVPVASALIDALAGQP